MGTGAPDRWAEPCVMDTYNRFGARMERGEGSLLFDAEGKRYVDFLAGIATTVLGHCDPAVTAAVCRQARTLLHCSNYYWIGPQNELARSLCAHTGMERVFFCNSGAEANEGAVKLARKYAAVSGRPEATRILSLEGSFHGRTLAMLSATGQEKMHRDFQPLPAGFSRVPKHDMGALEREATETVCAFLLEPVQGEGGVWPLEPGYLEAAARLCRERGILLIADEVQTGMGRTGTLLAMEHSGVRPDILTLAKGLGGGVPIGAFLARREVAEALRPGDHGSTFGGNPLACAAGMAVLGAVTAPGFLAEVRRKGERLRRGLEALTRTRAMAAGVRGQGLMLALELTVPAKEVLGACFAGGLLASTAGETGLRFVPALNIPDGLIDEGLEILDRVLENAERQE